MNQEMEIVIQRDGTVRVDATGFAGGTCKAFFEQIQNGLGTTLTEQKKPEYYMVEQEHLRA